MYKVTVRSPDGSEATYSLGSDQSLSIGRDEACDVELPSKRVSRRHARMFTRGERLFLEDLGSQNGVFVGGARLSEPTEIRPGHAIEIGEFKLLLEQQGGQAAGAEALLLRGQGSFAGRTLSVAARGFVGREEGVEYRIADDSVSRRHAELKPRPDGRLEIIDQGSSNGTFVAGRRLVPSSPVVAGPGDRLRFGETEWSVDSGTTAAAGDGAKRRLVLGAAATLVLVLGFVGLSGRGGAGREVEAGEGDEVAAASAAEGDEYVCDEVCSDV
jgi:pSer/pThr/pTyr-binding forkhead associated (FHA) protein